MSACPGQYIYKAHTCKMRGSLVLCRFGTDVFGDGALRGARQLSLLHIWVGGRWGGLGVVAGFFWGGSGVCVCVRTFFCLRSQKRFSDTWQHLLAATSKTFLIRCDIFSK